MAHVKTKTSPTPSWNRESGGHCKARSHQNLPSSGGGQLQPSPVHGDLSSRPAAAKQCPTKVKHNLDRAPRGYTETFRRRRRCFAIRGLSSCTSPSTRPPSHHIVPRPLAHLPTTHSPTCQPNCPSSTDRLESIMHSFCLRRRLVLEVLALAAAVPLPTTPRTSDQPFGNQGIGQARFGTCGI